MVVFIPRIRTINVRLSEAEYLELERLCVAKGARSLSDFVRHAMHEQVRAAAQESVLASTVNQHAELVKELEQRIEKLSAEISLLRAPRPVPEIERPESNAETARGYDAWEE